MDETTKAAASASTPRSKDGRTSPGARRLEDRPDYYDHTRPGMPRMPYAVSVALMFGREKAEAEWLSAIGRGVPDPVVVLVVDDRDEPERTTMRSCRRDEVNSLPAPLPGRPMSIVVMIGEEVHLTDFAAPTSGPRH